MTVAGATSIVGVQTALANVSPSPLTVDMRVAVSAPAMVITLLSSSAQIDSVVTGTGHIEDSNPTLPLLSFHDGRTYTGHAAVGTGTHTLGYAQDPAHSPPPSPQLIYDAVMLAGFSVSCPLRRRRLPRIAFLRRARMAEVALREPRL